MQKTFSEEQIAMASREAEAGTSVTEVCRKLGVSEQSFYRWNPSGPSCICPRRSHGQFETGELPTPHPQWPFPRSTRL